MLQTLSNALSCARYHNLMHRNADIVEIAIRSNLVDSFCSGVILTGPGWLYVAPTYHAQRLYARASGSYPLRLERSMDLPWSLAEPDVSAVLSEDGKTLRIYAVNSTRTLTETTFRLDGLPEVSGGKAYVLADSRGRGTLEVLNSRDDPDRVGVSVEDAGVAGRELRCRFPPFSLTMLELELGR